VLKLNKMVNPEIGKLSVDTSGVFENFKNSVDWVNYTVGRGGRSCTRKIQQWSYPLSAISYIPKKYEFLESIVLEMMGLIVSLCPEDENVIPIQMFLCYYQDGNNNCPMHRHGCRQITVSIGSDRLFKINTKTYNLKCGNFVVLHKQLHGVPKQIDVGERLSLNLFYCHSKDENVAVTVNKQGVPFRT
jgi:hypothetical protein